MSQEKTTPLSPPYKRGEVLLLYKEETDRRSEVVKKHNKLVRKNQIHNKPVLKEIRKKLRNNATSAEACLWSFLKNKQLDGRKFRRQHSVNNYILDFYCPSEKLAIELDGAHHFTEEGFCKDEQRDAFLKTLNIKVLRFENHTVFDFTENVLLTIAENFVTNVE